MKVVIGLGNPGKRYARGRHNLGFMVVDRFAQEKRVKIDRKKYHSLVGQWQWDGEEVLLVKPQSYMNQSDQSLLDIMRSLPITAKDLVVVHDDLDLPLGRIRIRERGGAGGHRGVLSILEALKESDFIRIRVGIGRPPAGINPTDYVLSPFSPAEEAALEEIVSRAAEALQKLLEEGCKQAMEIFNQVN